MRREPGAPGVRVATTSNRSARPRGRTCLSRARGEAPLLIAALLAMAWPQARADQPLWEAGLGVGVLRLPDYRGSDQSRTWVLPVPYIAYRGDILKADREGARVVVEAAAACAGARRADHRVAPADGRLAGQPQPQPRHQDQRLERVAAR